MTLHSLVEMSHPKTFFYVFSLRSGAELITMTILINKISGFFGILALFTGVHLSTLQLTMYLYSIAAFVVTIYLFPHIRRQSPFQNLALAFFYALDTVINLAYTAAFALAWFWVLASHPEENTGVAGAGTINAAAGFTSAEYNASHVDVVPVASNALAPEQAAVTYGKGVADGSRVGLGNALFETGSVASLSIVCMLWTVRFYFVVVVFAYARSVLRQHIATTSEPATAWQYSGKSGLAENPFEEGREEGQGWQGKLGRAMLKVAPKYWIGADEDGEWMRGLGGKFSRKRDNMVIDAQPPGVLERERRRRSGTGPPAVTIELPRFQGQRAVGEGESR